MKEVGGDFYVDFVLASTHPDYSPKQWDGKEVEGDIITKDCLDSMVNQWNQSTGSRKGSVHHKVGVEIPSIGQVGAQVVPLEDGEYGILATAKINKHFNDLKNTGYDYKRVVDEIKEGILDSVSIEYYTKDYGFVEREGKRYRQLKALDLAGFGHASRPINDNAKVVNWAFKELNLEIKSLVDKNQKKSEVKTMKEKKEDGLEDKPDVPKDNPSDEPVAPPKEEPKDEPKEENKEKVELSNAEYKEFLSYKTKQDVLKKESKERELKSHIELAVKEKIKEMAPMLGLGTHFSSEKSEMKEVKEYKEALKTNDIELQYKAAGRLVDAIGPDVLLRRSVMNQGSRKAQNFECKGRSITPKTLEVKEMAELKGMEFKTLTTTQNDETTYYQAAAELNDIYEPIIYNQFNDETTTFGILKKVSYAGRQKIQFRMGITRNAQVGGYLESTTSFTAGQQTRIKCEQDWAMYSAPVQISGLMIAENEGQGGMGDIWGEEISRSAVDLLKKINEDILTGSGATYNGTSTQYLLGFQHLILDTGNLYGKARGTYAALKGTDEAMSSANLTLAQLRKMRDTVRSNGAKVSNLALIMSPTQRSKYIAILQASQMVPVYSKRAGFEGMLEFDGIPIFEETDADSDDVFLVDMAETKVGIKVAPTLMDLNISDYDGKKSMIKTYFNLYSTKPNHNYWSSGFKTT